MKWSKITSVVVVLTLLFSLFSFQTGAEAAGTVYEYYYSLLSHDEQVAYNTIKGSISSSSASVELTGLTGVQTTFSLVGRNKSELDGILNTDANLNNSWNMIIKIIEKASQAFYLDHPEYFWANGGINSGASMEATGIMINTSTNLVAEGTMAIKPSIGFVTPGAAYASQLSSLRQAIAGIGASSGSDFDKIKKIHDAVCAKVVYNHQMAGGSGESGNAYNAMVGGSSVCQGYAMAVKMACDEFGLKCICVSGTGVTSNGSEAHMWNLVQLGGKWYGLDATWDDQSEIYYDFFLSGSGTYPSEGFPHRTFSESHVEGMDNFSAPSLNGTAYASLTPTVAPTAVPTQKPTTAPSAAATPEPTSSPTPKINTFDPNATRVPMTSAPASTPDRTDLPVQTLPSEENATAGPKATIVPAIATDEAPVETTPTENTSAESTSSAKPAPTDVPEGKPPLGDDTKKGCKGMITSEFFAAAIALTALILNKKIENEVKLMKNIVLNGTKLENYTVVTENNGACEFYSAADTLKYYVKKYIGVELSDGESENMIVVGRPLEEQFSVEITNENGNAVISAGSAIGAMQGVYEFIAKYLSDGIDTAVNLPNGTVYSSNEPDWKDVPALLTIQDKIVRSCMKIQSYLEFDHANGRIYTYQHHGYETVFDDVLAKNNRVTNCVITMDWVLKDIGLFRKGILNHTYDGNCNYCYESEEVKEACEKTFDIIYTKGTVRELGERGEIRPGDIMFYTDHNQIIINNTAALDGGRGHCDSYSVGAKFNCFVGKNPCLGSEPGFLFRPKDSV